MKLKKNVKMKTNTSLQVMVLVLALICPGLAVAATDEQIAEKLTILFRSARAVVSDNKGMIEDPKATPDVEKFLEAAKKNYARNAEMKLDESDDATKAMLKAISEVVTKAKSGGYASKKWSSPEYPKSFLPARFALEVAAAFSTSMKGKMAIRLTTTSDLLIGTDNKGDDWENKVMNDKFRNSKMSEAKAISEMTTYSGKNAYRYILPEYYNSTCLRCHAGEEGKRLHPGKIEGLINSFSGSISFVIFK